MSNILFGSKFDLSVETVETLFPDRLVIDGNVQRDLNMARAKKIAYYIIGALDGETLGAFFAPLVVSARQDGKLYILDGQHRWKGIREAINFLTKSVMRLRNKVNDKKISEDERASLKREYESATRVLDAINKTTIPLMIYRGLDEDTERQLFHDLNNLAQKPTKSLSLSYDSSNPFVVLARDTVRQVPKLAELVDTSKKAGKLEASKLFLFSTVFQTVQKLLSKSAFKGTDDNQKEAILQSAKDFFEIFINSLPNDFLEDKYLYKDAKVIQGVAVFVKQISDLKGVDWRVTLTEALKEFEFTAKNHLFVTIGGASKTEDGKVIFRGTSAGTSAVSKTLFATAKRLDANGVEVDDAYLANLTIDESEEDIIEDDVQDQLTQAVEELAQPPLTEEEDFLAALESEEETVGEVTEDDDEILF